MFNQDDRLNKVKENKVTLKGKSEANKSCLGKGKWRNAESTSHGKSLTGDSAGKEPETKPVCLNVASGGWRV